MSLRDENSLTLAILLADDGGEIQTRAHAYPDGQIIGVLAFGEYSRHGQVNASAPEAFDALAKAAAEVAAKMRAAEAERLKNAETTNGGAS